MTINTRLFQSTVASVFHKVFAVVSLSILISLPLSASAEDELVFPGEDTNNKIVYQFNKSDQTYQLAVLNTIRNMLRKHGDDIKIVVSAMGPGIHILLKDPGVPVIPAVRDQVESLAFYGVEFHACGNTLVTLHKEDKDVVEFATVVEAGVGDLMELQQQGYAYISW
jgi:intracellular sulfur oxidation DsrE/DsrF family protein